MRNIITEDGYEQALWGPDLEYECSLHTRTQVDGGRVLGGASNKHGCCVRPLAWTHVARGNLHESATYYITAHIHGAT